MPQAIAVVVTSIVGKGLAATLLSALVQVGAGLLLSAALAPRQRGGPEPEDGRVMFTRAVGERVKRYGRNLVGGQIVFGRAGGAGSAPGDAPGTSPLSSGRYLHRIAVHGHGPAHAILEYRMDGRRRAVEADGRVLSDEYTGGLGGSHLRIESRLGNSPAAVIDGVVDAAPEWGAAHRLDGLVTSWIRCQQRDPADQQRTYPNGPTELQVLAEFSLVHDPRQDATVYTDNAALVIADWIESADGFGATGALYEPDLIAAANRADVLRPLASGGSLPYWRLAGGAAMGDAPENPLRGMLDACAGDIRMRPDGQWSLNIGPDPAPVVTLVEADVLELLELDDGPGAVDRYTTLPATYIDETLDYAETTADPWVNAAEVARLGAEFIAAPLDLKWAPYHAQARHAAKIRALRDNPARRARLSCRISALPAIYERTVTLDLPGFGLSGTWRVEPFALSLADLTVTLSLSKVEPAAQGWSVAEEGAPLVLPPEQPDADRPPAMPEGVQAFGNGTGGDPGVLVVFDPPPEYEQPAGGFFEDPSGYAPEVDYYVAASPAGAETWSAMTPVSATQARMGGLTNGALYDVAVIAARSEIYDPTDPDVSAIIIRNVAARIDDPAPGVPPALSVAAAGGGAAIVSVTAPADPQLRTLEVLRGAVVVATLRAQPGAALEFSDQPGSGLFVWSARAVSISGAVGAATADFEQTIT